MDVVNIKVGREEASNLFKVLTSVGSKPEEGNLALPGRPASVGLGIDNLLHSTSLEGRVSVAEVANKARSSGAAALLIRRQEKRVAPRLRFA